MSLSKLLFKLKFLTEAKELEVMGQYSPDFETMNKDASHNNPYLELDGELRKLMKPDLEGLTPQVAFGYVKHVDPDRWLEAEPIIAKDAQLAYEYAGDTIGGPFPEDIDVSAIAEDPEYGPSYAESFLKDPNPDTWGERYLSGKAGSGVHGADDPQVPWSGV